MINEIVKKIDDMKSSALRLIVKNPHDTLDSIQNDIANGYVTACEKLADFILTEQKTPCYSLNDCEYKKDGNCFIFSPCPHQTKILTKGDVIRESNESLAEWYTEKTNNVLEQLGTGCRAEKEKVLDRLNQPQEDTNE